MKSVLISIRPQWCELIASGKKTVEIRKTKPKLETPFKVYIYCTAGVGKNTFCVPVSHKRIMEHYAETGTMDSLNAPIGNSKVVGEFVCDKVFLWNQDVHDEDTITLEEACELSCLGGDSLLKYADGYFYGWHISDLVIYKKPKPITDFVVRHCLWDNIRHNGCIDASNERCLDCRLKRPPQSWCYVEELPLRKLQEERKNKI